MKSKNPNSGTLPGQAPAADSACRSNRRTFFKQTAAMSGGLVIGLGLGSVEDDVAFATQKVNRNSSPSKLKITDLRIAEITDAPMRVPLIRIDTNQGLSGLGEVRDGGSKRYALMLKSRLLGENPCNVEKLFKKIKQFGHHGRQGGGVSGVEMALWDLAGKAYGVPVYQMLGGKYRDKIRLYTDTTVSEEPDVYAERLADRVKKGFTFLKMDLGIRLLERGKNVLTIPGTFNRSEYRLVEHPFTRIQITEKGLDRLTEYVARVREKIGYEIPLAADHFGHIGMNECIRLGNALERYQVAWLEDLIPWKYTDMWREITETIHVPTLTGEDIYLRDGFADLIRKRAVDMIHPDLATAGGILETKKIGDFAQEHGIAMALHFAGSPVSFMANAHCAAATENFVALEHHSVEVPWWENLVTGIEKPLVHDGFLHVPDSPGLGVELNPDVVKEHLLEDEGYFEPTDEWNEDRSNDRLWS